MVHSLFSPLFLWCRSHYFTWIIFSVIIRLSFSDFQQQQQHSHEKESNNKEYGIVSKEPSGLYLGPYFDSNRNPPNISTHVANNVFLPCYVKQLGNKSVSWIRTSDAHIVSVDRYTFIADDRFQVIPIGESWTLQIKYVQPRDAGFYECQISTSPKLAFRTQLHVLVPQIRISGSEQNIFVWEGSEVKLKCIVEYGQLVQLAKLQWQKNEATLEGNSLSAIFQSKMEGSSILSTLTFPNARRDDTGNYTCALDNVGSASVTLHVLNGENPAAMQHGYGTYGTSAAAAAASALNFPSFPYFNLLKNLFFFLDPSSATHHNHFNFDSFDFKAFHILTTIAVVGSQIIFNYCGSSSVCQWS